MLAGRRLVCAALLATVLCGCGGGQGEDCWSRRRNWRRCGRRRGDRWNPARDPRGPDPHQPDRHRSDGQAALRRASRRRQRQRRRSRLAQDRARAAAGRHRAGGGRARPLRPGRRAACAGARLDRTNPLRDRAMVRAGLRDRRRFRNALARHRRRRLLRADRRPRQRRRREALRRLRAGRRGGRARGGRPQPGGGGPLPAQTLGAGLGAGWNHALRDAPPRSGGERLRDGAAGAHHDLSARRRSGQQRAERAARSGARHLRRRHPPRDVRALGRAPHAGDRHAATDARLPEHGLPGALDPRSDRHPARAPVGAGAIRATVRRSATSSRDHTPSPSPPTAGWPSSPTPTARTC